MWLAVFFLFSILYTCIIIIYHTTEMKTIIWKAAHDNDKEKITQLLPQATVEDLQYEREVNKIAYMTYAF